MHWVLVCLLAFAGIACAQSTASLTGRVVDPDGAAVRGARVTLSNTLTGFLRESLTQPEGTFAFSNVPFQTYALSIEHPGFAPERRAVALLTNVPAAETIQLSLATQTDHVEVSAFDTTTLVQPEATGTRTELNALAIERMPVPPGSRGLEAVLLSLPGFAANANGAIHPRGAHNQMTYVIDGMPISDQLTGSFANSVDAAIVQTVELFTGNVPAEFGSKVSGVAQITTRSGMGSGRGLGGSIEAAASGFDTLSNTAQFTGESGRLGYFASVRTIKSHRFLDQVSLDNLHNGGNSERGFTRLDYQASERDILRLNLMAGRSAFELANLRSQQAAAQDQRQRLEELAASLAWVRTLGARTTVDSMAAFRTSIAQLVPSSGDTPVTAAQARHLSTLTLAVRVNHQSGAHVVRAGTDLQHFPVSENFSFGATDPAFNDPACECFRPTLAAHDLSRGGGLFHFSQKASGSLRTAFAQDHIRWRRFVVSLGLRYDQYRFLVRGNQLQPRLGVSFHLRETGTVLRASYNRNYQTPPNENLLLSSSEEAGVLVPAAVRQALGGALIRVHPERQNVYEAGIQQAIGTHASLNAAFYHKDARDMQDNDNFFNTGIIFPTSLSRSRINGAEARLTLAPLRGLSGSLSATHYHAVVTPPFTGGLFIGSTAISLFSAGPFVIDHDQKLGVHATLQYQLSKSVWISGAARYDSGLVVNPSDPAQVARDPDYFDLLPYVNLASNPPRVRPRAIADLAIGYERTREGRRSWEFTVQVSNVANRTALYNFQSIFVGTRLVQPRTAGARLRWFF